MGQGCEYRLTDKLTASFLCSALHQSRSVPLIHLSISRSALPSFMNNIRELFNLGHSRLSRELLQCYLRVSYLMNPTEVPQASFGSQGLE